MHKTTHNRPITLFHKTHIHLKCYVKRYKFFTRGVIPSGHPPEMSTERQRNKPFTYLSGDSYGATLAVTDRSNYTSGYENVCGGWQQWKRSGRRSRSTAVKTREEIAQWSVAFGACWAKDAESGDIRNRYATRRVARPFPLLTYTLARAAAELLKQRTISGALCTYDCWRATPNINITIAIHLQNNSCDCCQLLY